MPNNNIARLNETRNNLLGEIHEHNKTVSKLLDALQKNNPEKLDEIASQLGVTTPNRQLQIACIMEAILEEHAVLAIQYQQLCMEQQRQFSEDYYAEIRKEMRETNERLKEAILRAYENQKEIEFLRIAAASQTEIQLAIQRYQNEVKELTEKRDHQLLILKQIDQEIEIYNKRIGSTLYQIIESIMIGSLVNCQQHPAVDGKKLEDNLITFARDVESGLVLISSFRDVLKAKIRNSGKDDKPLNEDVVNNITDEILSAPKLAIDLTHAALLENRKILEKSKLQDIEHQLKIANDSLVKCIELGKAEAVDLHKEGISPALTERIEVRVREKIEVTQIEDKQKRIREATQDVMPTSDIKESKRLGVEKNTPSSEEAKLSKLEKRAHDLYRGELQYGNHQDDLRVDISTSLSKRNKYRENEDDPAEKQEIKGPRR